jgi:hypothetical protein
MTKVKVTFRNFENAAKNCQHCDKQLHACERRFSKARQGTMSNLFESQSKVVVSPVAMATAREFLFGRATIDTYRAMLEVKKRRNAWRHDGSIV